jgi:hydroxybutyrate-dimer hydrolase
MHAHLRSNAPLPPSQVVRTVPRALNTNPPNGLAVPITASNVPPIRATPAAGDQIGFSGSSIAVPQ